MIKKNYFGGDEEHKGSIIKKLKIKIIDTYTSKTILAETLHAKELKTNTVA